MASSSAAMNNLMHLYLVELGVKEEAIQEFLSKAKAAIGLEAFESFRVWRKITEPSQILQKMELMGPFEVADGHSSGSASVKNLTAMDAKVTRVIFDLNVPPDDEDEQPLKDIMQDGAKPNFKVGGVEDEDSTVGKRKMIEDEDESNTLDLVKKMRAAAFASCEKIEVPK